MFRKASRFLAATTCAALLLPCAAPAVLSAAAEACALESSEADTIPYSLIVCGTLISDCIPYHSDGQYALIPFVPMLEGLGISLDWRMTTQRASRSAAKSSCWTPPRGHSPMRICPASRCSCPPPAANTLPSSRQSAAFSWWIRTRCCCSSSGITSIVTVTMRILPWKSASVRTRLHQHKRKDLPHSASPFFIPRKKSGLLFHRTSRSIFTQPPNYAWGPASTSALPASLPVYLTKFFSKRDARSFALFSHSEASA